MKRLLAAAALALAAACAPNPPAPVDVRVLVYNYETRMYEPRTVQLKTVTDVTAMDGPVAKIYGGAKFAINNSDQGFLDAWDSQDPVRILDAIRKNAGGPVNVGWIDVDGALTPADFHSLNLATTYYNLERAYEFFVKVGKLNSTTFGTPTVYYFPDYIEEGEKLKDNAYFMSLAQAFFILPFESLQQVPLAINGGVVGHEYSHAIFNFRVYGKAPLPRVSSTWDLDGATPGLNLLGALDEGSADVFGTGITCDEKLENCNPEFIGASLPEQFVPARRVDKPHCMTESLSKSLLTLSNDPWRTGCEPFGCDYVLGSVFASAVWRATQDAEAIKQLGQGETRRLVMQALWNAQGGGGNAPSWKELIADAVTDQFLFTLEAKNGKPGVLDAVIDGATDPKVKSALCSAFMDRFNLSMSQLARCPVTAQSYKECQ